MERMLKRTQIRKYLFDLLYSNEIPQSADCDVGFLFVNCNDEPAPIYDSYTHEAFENIEQSFVKEEDKRGNVAFNVAIDNESYTLTQTRIDTLSINFHIDIICRASSGELRQDILDIIQQRILYRLFSYASFANPNDPTQKIQSFMRTAKPTISVNDDTEYDGSYTIRTLSFSLNTNECIEQTQCSNVPLCFNLTTDIGGC